MVLYEFIFWLSIIAVCYAYAGYPVILWLIGLIMPKNSSPKKTDGINTSVSILISAYNEEDIIEKKILNALSLNYPKNLLEIIIISDGSNDRTDEIAARYKHKGISLYHYEGRIGKTACLNKSIPSAKGEIVVFSDANSMYDKDAIRHLIKHFSENDVGFVTGHTKYIGSDNCESDSLGLYGKVEKLTKKLESKIWSCVGADGAIFAVRKCLYVRLNHYDINDFVIPLNVNKQGFKGVFDEDAFCFEKTARDQTGEFYRQIRITNRTLRAIFKHKELLNPLKYKIFSFELISHKLIKFIVPYLLLLIFTLNIVILLNNLSAIYFFILVMQVFFYVFSFVKHEKVGLTYLSKIGSCCRMFTLFNIAIMAGWIKYFQGETYTTWNPDR